MLFGFLSSSLLFNSVASFTKLHGFVLSDAHFDCCDQNGYHVYFFFLYIYIYWRCVRLVLFFWHLCCIFFCLILTWSLWVLIWWSFILGWWQNDEASFPKWSEGRCSWWRESWEWKQWRTRGGGVIFDLYSALYRVIVTGSSRGNSWEKRKVELSFQWSDCFVNEAYIISFGIWNVVLTHPDAPHIWIIFDHVF